MIELSENCENCRKKKVREVEDNEESGGECTNTKTCALCQELTEAMAQAERDQQENQAEEYECKVEVDINGESYCECNYSLSGELVGQKPMAWHNNVSKRNLDHHREEESLGP